jgi:hypothetical protein
MNAGPKPGYKEVDEIRGDIQAKKNGTLVIKQKDIKKIIDSSIKKKNNGGAYVSLSADLADHKAFVIVLNKKGEPS